MWCFAFWLTHRRLSACPFCNRIVCFHRDFVCFLFAFARCAVSQYVDRYPYLLLLFICLFCDYPYLDLRLPAYSWTGYIRCVHYWRTTVRPARKAWSPERLHAAKTCRTSTPAWVFLLGRSPIILHYCASGRCPSGDQALRAKRAMLAGSRHSNCILASSLELVGEKGCGQCREKNYRQNKGIGYVPRGRL